MKHSNGLDVMCVCLCVCKCAVCVCGREHMYEYVHVCKCTVCGVSHMSFLWSVYFFCYAKVCHLLEAAGDPMTMTL